MIFSSNNVFGMEGLQIQESKSDSEHLVTNIFLQGGDIQCSHFDESKIELRFTDDRLVVINLGSIAKHSEKFIAEMQDASKDFEIKKICGLLLQEFSCYKQKTVMDSLEEYCGSVICFYLLNRILPAQTQYSNAIAFMLGFLNPNHNGEFQMASYVFLSDEYTKQIAACFDTLIRVVVAQRLKCIPDMYDFGPKFTAELDIKEKVSQEQYIERVLTEFNDPKLVSFALKLSYNLAIQLSEKVAKMKTGV
jgi:hypothetical protein